MSGDRVYGGGVRRTATSLVGGVLDNDIRLVVLEVTQRNEDDVSLVNPNLGQGRSDNGRRTQPWPTHLLPHLPSNVG